MFIPTAQGESEHGRLTATSLVPARYTVCNLKRDRYSRVVPEHVNPTAKARVSMASIHRLSLLVQSLLSQKGVDVFELFLSVLVARSKAKECSGDCQTTSLVPTKYFCCTV